MQKTSTGMTAIELKASLYHDIDTIAQSEEYLLRAKKYIKRLAKEFMASTASTVEKKGVALSAETMKSIKRSEEQYARGEYKTLSSKQEIDDFLESL